MSHIQDSTKRRECKHLTLSDRKIIENSLRDGLTPREIARNLYRSKSTITREIRRGLITYKKINPYVSRNPDVQDYIWVTEYDAETAQRKYKESRSACRNKIKLLDFEEFLDYAEEQIRSKKYSPDSIVGYARRMKLFERIPCTKTLYNYIEMGLLSVKNLDLVQKVRRKQRKKHPPREHKRLHGRSIEERPDIINERLEFGHWEGDSIVGKDGKSSIITLVERKTGYVIMLKVSAKTAKETGKALKKLKRYSHFREIFKSITFDNGTEFAASAGFEALRIIVYYAHPFSAFERGLNEHINGIIRRYLPKGMDLSYPSQRQLNRISHLVNIMPRKKINYSTPDTLFQQELSAIIQ